MDGSTCVIVRGFDQSVPKHASSCSSVPFSPRRRKHPRSTSLGMRPTKSSLQAPNRSTQSPTSTDRPTPPTRNGWRRRFSSFRQHALSECKEKIPAHAGIFSDLGIGDYLVFNQVRVFMSEIVTFTSVVVFMSSPVWSNWLQAVTGTSMT